MDLLNIESPNLTQYLGMFTTTTVLRFDENGALVGQLSWTEYIYYIYCLLFCFLTVL